MAGRYLFGPISGSFAEQNLFRQRQAGSCLAFGSEATPDLAVEPGESWEEIASRFPPEWQPDFLVLALWYTTIPAYLWSAPVPIIGLAGDWNLLWHYYRRRLHACDLVLTDTVGVEKLAAEGICHAWVANLFGCGREWLEPRTDAEERRTERDIDILFVGNLHPAVQRERLPWLARLARLGERWNVQIHQEIFGAEYRQLLRRARIVFNRGIRGECNLRAFEAAAAGALLFQEAENREVPAYFRGRQECVYYTDENLEELLKYYLEHEEERRNIAEAARERVPEYTFENLWERSLETIEQEWPQISERSRQRPTPSPEESLSIRTWEALSSTSGPGPRLARDLAAALVLRPFDAGLHNALGLVEALEAKREGLAEPAQAARAVGYFQRAIAHEPGHVVAGLNLVEALVALQQYPQAIEQARRVLTIVERTGRLDFQMLDAGHFPPVFDFFRVEWERAAWDNAGQPRSEVRNKHDLLRWRLHGLLAELTGDLGHYYEAVVARPDLSTTQAALGCALGRQGKAADAVPHLRRAVQSSPFDLNAARALYQALGETGDAEGQRELARDRDLLASAAPRVVPPELWFDGASSRRQAAAFVSSPARPAVGTGLAITWEGPMRAAHSLGLVNREVCRRLIERGHEVSLLAAEPPAGEVPSVAIEPLLGGRLGRTLARPADVNVRHQWPPHFTPPGSGRWVIFQHWEFGSLPRAWIEPMSRQVDEVWVASRYARDCFVQSGIPAERVQVIPLGVDIGRFHPQAPPLRLPTNKRFKFLFVGGTIHRKGIDLLLDAYTQAFRRSDDVCLVIKDMGVGTFYGGQTAEQRIAELQAAADAPEIVYFSESLTEEELAGLYTACNCLVHPYRGEGFGLPIAEAMASGLPVVVTGHGAALDFCNEQNAFLIPARVVHFREKYVGDMETVDCPWLAEPDKDDLRTLLRHVIEDGGDIHARADVGRRHIQQHFTWDHTAAAVEARLKAICEQVRSPRSIVRSKESDEAGSQRTTDYGPRTKVSLCMIVRNEEENLPACLASADGLFDEKIVVDTGSTDRTKEIAQHLGTRVFEFPWVDSFAAARNESLRNATGDWIFWLDADDRLDNENRAKLEMLFRTLGCHNAAYVMKCLCLPDPVTGTATAVDHVRLFRNRPSIRWEHRIHEQILPAIRRSGGTVHFTDIVIQHAGYQDAALRQSKRERDLRLLLLEHAEQPEHPFTLFNLGSSYLDLSRPAEALPLLRRSLERSDPGDSIVRKLYYLIVQCHRQLRQPVEALGACRQGRMYYPQDAELLNQEAQLRSEQDDLAGGEACFLQLLAGQEGAHFASVPLGLQGYITRHNLAVIYQRQGRLAEAEAQWRAALAERSDYLAGWSGLGELYLAQERWSEVEEVAQRLECDPREPVEGTLLRARAHLARHEFAAARRLLETLIEMHPTAIQPRVLLTHVLLQEDRDPDAAEQALRDVLALDPNHGEARHNLAMLEQRRAVCV